MEKIFRSRVLGMGIEEVVTPAQSAGDRIPGDPAGAIKSSFSAGPSARLHNGLVLAAPIAPVAHQKV